jgi:hypothetical protein
MQGSQRVKAPRILGRLPSPFLRGIALFAVISAGGAARAGELGSLTLEDVERALAANPEAKWAAADSGASAQFGTPVLGEAGLPSGINFGLRGWQGPRRKSMAEKLRIDDPLPGLPGKWDWRNATVNGVTGNFMSPVRNQGKCGSCVAFATVATFEGTLAVANGSPRLDVNVSEQDLFNTIGACAFGSWPSSGMSEVVNNGIPDEVCMPYTSGRKGEDGEASSACKNRADRLLKANDDSFVSSPAAIKQALMNGPLQTTMTVYEDFMFYAGGVYKHVTGPQMGGHAITLVGYDDSERAWIAKNSWGTAWGEGGYFRISYDDDSGFADEAYGFSVDGSAISMRVDSPDYFSAVRGKVVVEVSVFDESVDSVRWELASESSQRWLMGNASVASGELKAKGSFRAGVRTFRGTIDTDGIEDGTYSLAVSASNRGTQSGRKAYSRFVVANDEADPAHPAIAISPDFDNSVPVTSRVYFKFDGSGLAGVSRAAFTHADLVIEGPKSARIRFDDPGIDAMFGWRTQMFPNGTYKVRVEGGVGEIHNFVSNTLEVKVENK